MKKTFLITLLVLIYTNSFTQQRNYQKEVQISKQEFNKHLPVFDFLSKPLKKIKINGIIKIKTQKKTITLKDDGEMLQYRYEGYSANSYTRTGA